MRFQILFFIAILGFSLFLNACTSAQDNSTNTKSATANSNAAANPANNPLATTKTPESATSNNAPTLAPVVQNYYAALQKKDEAGARKYLSQAALKYWNDEMKSEKKMSLLAILEDNESPLEEKREVRNEKTEGDSAVAEMKGGSLGVWTKIKFVKENGEWKLASPKESIALQDIKPTDTNTGK